MCVTQPKSNNIYTQGHTLLSVYVCMYTCITTVSNSTSSKTRGSFQADININSFNKLNDYCTRFFSGSVTATAASLHTQSSTIKNEHDLMNTTCMLNMNMKGSVDGIAGDVMKVSTSSSNNNSIPTSATNAVKTHTHLLALESAITAQQHNQKVCRSIYI